ncbi:MAG: PAS domain S-box protein [Candidatus Nanopelagicales bacterium]|jgi:diguanylate cyclase (GGDEF)-like protein/PAS domain S-box-containing protein
MAEQVGDPRRSTVSESHLQQLLTFSADVIFDIAPDNTYRWVTPSVTDLLGWSPDELVGMTGADLWHPDDAPLLSAARENPIGGYASVRRFRMKTRSGTFRWVSGSSNEIRINGELLGRVAAIRDAEEQMAAESDLRASEQHYRMLAENASDVIARASPDGTIEWISPSVTRMLGWRPEEMTGKPIFGFLNPEDMPAIQEAQARIRDGEALNFDARIRTSDGSYRWVASQVRPVFDRSGALTARVAGWRDIHERKQASEALAISEDLFRTAMDGSAIGTCLVAADGSFMRVNLALSEMLGRSQEQLMEMTWQEITHPEDLNVDQELVDQILRGERDRYRLRKRYLRPDKEVVWGDLSVACCRNSDGSVRNFVSQIVDITELKRVTDAAQAAEHRYKLMASNASDVVFMAGPDRVIRWVSPTVTRSLGWSPDELVGTVAADLVHAADREDVQESIRHLYSDEPGDNAVDFRMRWRTRTGTYRWMLGTGTRVMSASGTLEYVVAGLRDITEEVAAREYLSRVLSAQVDPTFILTPVRDEVGQIVDLVYTDLNPAACSYLHSSREAVLNRTVFELFGGEPSVNLLRWCSSALATDAPVILDDECLVSEITHGSRWLDIRAVPVQGQVSLTIRDVTDRHRAAEAIAASEQKFRLLAENSTDAVLHARAGVMVWLSPSLTNNLGWSPEDWQGHRFEEFTHPDDIALAQSRRAEINSGKTRITRLRLRDVDDNYHWVEVHAAPFQDANGAADGIVASFRTIDSQVEAESALETRARHDDLTGLINRAEVFSQLRARLAQQPRTGKEVAVAFCDLDGFKEINDTYGHKMGDQVLITLAHEIRRLLRRDDVVARIGGDEILLVLNGVHDLDGAVAVAEKVRANCSEVHEYQGEQYVPRISIGVTVMRSGENVDDLIARADRAMYSVKRMGGNQVVGVN